MKKTNAQDIISDALKPDNPYNTSEVMSVIDMALEIGMPDDTIIPIWGDTEMALTHPLYVGQLKTIRKALTLLDKIEKGELIVMEKERSGKTEVYAKVSLDELLGGDDES